MAAVEPHLGLLLVGDDVGGLLLEPPVLVLRLDDGLLELDLRVGLLVELLVRACGEVLPQPPEELEHAGEPTGSASGWPDAGASRGPATRGTPKATTEPTYTTTPTSDRATTAATPIWVAVAVGSSATATVTAAAMRRPASTTVATDRTRPAEVEARVAVGQDDEGDHRRDGVGDRVGHGQAHHAEGPDEDDREHDVQPFSAQFRKNGVRVSCSA